MVVIVRGNILRQPSRSEILCFSCRSFSRPERAHPYFVAPIQPCVPAGINIVARLCHSPANNSDRTPGKRYYEFSSPPQSPRERADNICLRSFPDRGHRKADNYCSFSIFIFLFNSGIDQHPLPTRVPLMNVKNGVAYDVPVFFRK